MKYCLLSITFILSFQTSSQNKSQFEYGNYTVIKNTASNYYQILEGDSLVLDQLKFVDYIAMSIQAQTSDLIYTENPLQILDAQGEVFFVNQQLERINNLLTEDMLYCGTVDHYALNIIKKDKNYIVEKLFSPITANEPDTTPIVDTIPQEGIKEISFLNGQQSIAYDENGYFPEKLIIKFLDGSMALREAGKTYYYQGIDPSNIFCVKVKQDGFWGIKDVTAIAYKNLGAFNFHLAPFIKPNGSRGYIDDKGNEYSYSL